jgi:VanZ family protein
MFYAITDEIHQIFVPGRDGIVFDVIIDTFGAIFGLEICKLLKKITKK